VDGRADSGSGARVAHVRLRSTPWIVAKSAGRKSALADVPRTGCRTRGLCGINENDLITLDVHPMLEEIIGFTGPADLQQPITSKREVQTTVTVKDGETLVLGGLIKETNTKAVEKVWLLGDIPLIKYLFSTTSTKKEKTDLLIFITPKIM